MSRRKQSNPKPLKRDDDDMQDEKTDELETSRAQSKTPSPNRSPAPTPNESPHRNDAPVDDKIDRVVEIKQEFDANDNVEIARDNQSPKQLDRAASHATPRLRLNANLATDPALRPDATVIKFTAADDSNDDAKSRSPLVPTTTNTAEYLAAAYQSVALAGRFYGLSHPLVDSVIAQQKDDGPRVSLQPVYKCLPCGIRYSNLDTLKAHQANYCAFRKNASDSTEEDAKSEADPRTGKRGTSVDGNVSDGSTSAKTPRTGKQYACAHCSYSADKKVSLNRHMRMHSVSPVGVGGNSSGATTTNGECSQDATDRYCTECDIKFISAEVFRAHKQNYCSTRHIIKTGVAHPIANTPNSNDSIRSPTASPSDTTPEAQAARLLSSNIPQYLALPTNPILIVPYALIQGASVLSSSSIGASMPATDLPCFIYPNGTIQTVSQAIATTSNKISTQSSNIRSSASNSADSSILKASNKRRDTGPLDLSVVRSEMLLNDEKENRESSSPSTTPEQIICAPSLPGSPPLTPSPPKRSHMSSPQSPTRKSRRYHESRSNSPRAKSNHSETRQTTPSPDRSESGSVAPAPNSISPNFFTDKLPFPYAALHPLLISAPLVAAIDLPGVAQTSQGALVKKGVSKCKECNIVFCKHENYIAHKKHYCSARLQEHPDVNVSASPPTSPVAEKRILASPTPVTPTLQYQQLICAACGIKFASMDNLQAHQSYYCLKRTATTTSGAVAEPPVDPLQIRKCLKCKIIHDATQPCAILSPPIAAQTDGWKCPCCEYVSATAAAAQRHMETHTNVKAYRCLICGYKGNTLRGIRTHIRMHFDKRTCNDMQEDKYIICIFDTDVDVDNAATDETDTSKIYQCDKCTYTTSSRNSVTRHVKLMHGSNSTSPIDTNGAEQLTKAIKLEVDEEKLSDDVTVGAIKQEVDDDTPNIDNNVRTVLNGTRSPSRDFVANQSSTYCQSCDISFKYYKSFVTHKQYYCSSHVNERAGNRAAQSVVL